MDFQEQPPKLDHRTPPWFKKWADALYSYLKDHRPVPGTNIIMTAADGGGVLISTALGTLQKAPGYMAIAGNPVKVLVVLVIPEEEEE